MIGSISLNPPFFLRVVLTITLFLFDGSVLFMRFREMNEYVFDDVLQWVRDCASKVGDVSDLLTASNLEELVEKLDDLEVKDESLADLLLEGVKKCMADLSERRRKVTDGDRWDDFVKLATIDYLLDTIVDSVKGNF